MLYNYTLCLHVYMAYGCGSSTFMNDALDDDPPVFVCDLHAFSGHEAAPLSCRNQIFEDLRSQTASNIAVATDSADLEVDPPRTSSIDDTAVKFEARDA